MQVVGCKVCGRLIESLEDGIMVSAMGRPLFPVHREACFAVVRGGAAAAASMAFQGAKTLLRVKAPHVATFLETAAAMMKKAEANGHQ